MKLTKTQQQLIDNQRHGRVIVESYHGQGPEGGKVSGGSRRQTAANKLQTFGIIERVDHHSSAVAKNGYTIHVTTNVYKIVNH